MKENVILVDHNDNELGLEEKIAAHKKAGKLHRAFSVLIFNKKGQTLLQQRASSKYHSAGLWSNAVDGHQRKGEKTVDAAERRLYEELGIRCKLNEIFEFEYEAKMKDGFIEHEYDHVLFGVYNKDPKLNKKEAQAFRWVKLDEMKHLINENPDAFVPWLRLSMDEIINYYGTYTGK